MTKDLKIEFHRLSLVTSSTFVFFARGCISIRIQTAGVGVGLRKITTPCARIRMFYAMQQRGLKEDACRPLHPADKITPSTYIHPKITTAPDARLLPLKSLQTSLIRTR